MVGGWQEEWSPSSPQGAAGCPAGYLPAGLGKLQQGCCPRDSLLCYKQAAKCFCFFCHKPLSLAMGRVSWGELLVSRSWPYPRQLLSAWNLPPALFLCDRTGSHSPHVSSYRYLFGRKSLFCWFLPVLTVTAHPFPWMSLLNLQDQHNPILNMTYLKDKHLLPALLLIQIKVFCFLT